MSDERQYATYVSSEPHYFHSGCLPGCNPIDLHDSFGKRTRHHREHMACLSGSGNDSIEHREEDQSDQLAG